MDHRRVPTELFFVRRSDRLPIRVGGSWPIRCAVDGPAVAETYCNTTFADDEGFEK